MAKIGAQRAAELTGKSKSTIQRAMNGGKISFERDANGRRVVDVSELERVFGLKKSETAKTQTSNAVEQELEKATAMLETERLKTRNHLGGLRWRYWKHMLKQPVALFGAAKFIFRKSVNLTGHRDVPDGVAERYPAIVGRWPKQQASQASLSLINHKSVCRRG